MQIVGIVANFTDSEMGEALFELFPSYQKLPIQLVPPLVFVFTPRIIDPQHFGSIIIGYLGLDNIMITIVKIWG